MLRLNDNPTAADFESWFTTSDDARRVQMAQGLLPEIKAS